MSTYEISQSSLLCLKAEILRKQEELKKATLENKVRKAPTKKPLEFKNKGVEQRQENDHNEEDENLLRKSRTMLEQKALLYEKLSKRTHFSDEELEHNRRFLVRFDKKGRGNKSSDEEIEDSNDYDARDAEDEWVEFTDCLGRTRKCMRKDLNFMKSKDDDMKASIEKDENRSEQMCKPPPEVEEPPIDKEVEEFGEESEMLSSDMQRELLRRQWEKEEEELRHKDDIHYQDILFNEARTHGVGYYGFSKDDHERAKQQEALKKLREETQQQQKKAGDMKMLREKQLAARIKAARNRKRARMGLPPEEDEPEPQVQETIIEEAKPQEKKEDEEKLERKLEEARKKHVRPWDIGKEGAKKEHYEHTQEEWVDKKRKERKDEFAPPSAYKRSFRGEDKRQHDDFESNKTLFFSSKKKDKESLKKPDETTHTNPYKTKQTIDYCQSSKMEPTPIINECEDFDDVQNDVSDVQIEEEVNHNRGRGVAIPPPATFEYYGPNSSKKPKMDKSENMQDSIMAGLQFLRQKVEKKGSSKRGDEFLD